MGGERAGGACGLIRGPEQDTRSCRYGDPAGVEAGATGASDAPAGYHYVQFSSLSFQYFVPATAIPAWSPFFVSM